MHIMKRMVTDLLGLDVGYITSVESECSKFFGVF